MENQTETQNNTVIFNVDAPEQDVFIEGNKEKLPKYTLPRGERLHISLEQIGELNTQFFNRITELKAGGAYAPAELKSVMESVIYLSYNEELEKLRRANWLESSVEEAFLSELNARLIPQRWRRFFRMRQNPAQTLLDERVRREERLYYRRKADELPTEERELLPFEIIIQSLKATLPRMRKKRREVINEIIDQLYDGYEGKADECKRLTAELEEALRAKEGAEERARNAEEMLEEFLKESTPAPDETATVEIEPAEEPKTPAEAEPTEEPRAEGEEASETEKAEESESLSYDGLEGMDEQG